MGKLVNVDRGRHKGANRGGGHVEHDFSGRLEDGRVLNMSGGAGGVEYDADFRVLGYGIDAPDGGFKAEPPGPLQALRLHDAGHSFHLHVLTAHDLVHQVGADVTRPNDSYLDFFHSDSPYCADYSTNFTVTLPMP
ncbi:hypothetical protein SDC9_65618 [bioreactor metagenome]|uniref:Uncharacterized protein n=1 Tax=bioreactor metagenome TaxID=1076179 RepID=A0A644XSI0_9ZZZZ